MPIQQLTALANKFSTGSIPNGQDFKDLIDTLHDTVETLLPDQFNQQGNALVTDGENLTWQPVTAGPQGIPGVDGAQGLRGVPGVQLAPMGAWTMASTYEAGQLVTYNGNTYECIALSDGDEPPNADFWRIFVTKGDTGPRGEQGVQGAQGHLGWQGPPGNRGYQGYQGEPSYVQGPQGEQGYQGEQSTVQGPQGFQGPQGVQGAASTVQGPVGETGVQGDRGYQGAVSTVPGPRGPQGEVGQASTVPGPQGPKGIMGEGFKITKVYPSEYAIQNDFTPTGIEVGQFGIVQSASADNNNLYIWNGSAYNFIGNVADAMGFQGEAGVQGAQGDRGVQGLQGVQGEQGYQGTQGQIGDTGLTGSIGMQGYQGSQGFQGAQGEASTVQGPQGLQGFQGFGLQGPQGFQSDVPGPQGVQGTQGFQGEIGYQGVQGEVGVQGVQGTQGFQGSKGLNWMDHWHLDTIYKIDDVIFHSGSSWKCEIEHSGVAPSSSTPQWSILAEKGESGVAFLHGGTITGEDDGIVGAAIDDTEEFGSSMSTWSSLNIYQKTQNPKLFNYSERVISLGSIGANVTLNVRNAPIYLATLGANATFTLTGATAGAMYSITLLLKNDSLADRTVVFNNTKFEGGIVPIKTKTADALDMWTFSCYDGVNWIGALTMRDIK